MQQKRIDSIIHWIPQKRKRFRLKEQNTINHWMVQAKKERAEWYSSQRSEDKEKLSDRAEWYSSLNPEEKEKLLFDRANVIVH